MELFRETKNLLQILQEHGGIDSECYILSAMELDDAEKRIAAIEYRLSSLTPSLSNAELHKMRSDAETERNRRRGAASTTDKPASPAQ